MRVSPAVKIQKTLDKVAQLLTVISQTAEKLEPKSNVVKLVSKKAKKVKKRKYTKKAK